MGYKLKPTHTIQQLFFWLHLLSLDIAAGACLLGSTFTRLIPFTISWYAYVLLFNSGLLVYWTDHLIDSKNEKVIALSIRHQFFKNHFTLFFISALLLVIVNAYLVILFLDIIKLLIGTIALLLAAIYIFGHRKFPRILLFEKEILVGILYGFAIGLLPVLSLGNYAYFIWPEILLISFLLILCTIQNTFSIAKIECVADLSSGTRNLATNYSFSTLSELQIMFFVLQLILSIVLILIAPLNSTYLVTGILAANSIVQYFLPNYATMVKDESYRYLGEWLFILCGLLLYIL